MKQASAVVAHRDALVTWARSSAASALLLIMAAAGLGCSFESETTPDPARPPNFVLIVVDTLRADRLDRGGDRKNTLPAFHRLRSESTDFPNARSTSSWTLPATVSLFVSQLPSQHGVTAWGSSMGEEHATFVEALREAGYRTGGWSANHLIREERGFGRGFEVFELVTHPEWKFGMPPQHPHAFALAEHLTSRALAWLDETRAASADDPFFVYLHFMEPHTPYLCPPQGGEACRAVAMTLNRHLVTTFWDFDDEQASLISGFYDSDIERMDSALDQLYAALAERGLLENTWLILTSDHGEMLGEHDLYVHGNALYEEALRIPLFVRTPRPGNTRSTGPVSLIDIAPTILEAAGIDPPAAFRGRSLGPALKARLLDPQPIVAELLPLRDEASKHYRHVLAVTSGSNKLVLGVDGKLERFDLAADPAERVALAAEMRDLEAYLSQAGVEFRHLEDLSKEVPKPSPEALEDLKALGYVQE
jgi:arylsulfatase A-like enzyme